MSSDGPQAGEVITMTEELRISFKNHARFVRSKKARDMEGENPLWRLTSYTESVVLLGTLAD